MGLQVSNNNNNNNNNNNYYYYYYYFEEIMELKTLVSTCDLGL